MSYLFEIIKNLLKLNKSKRKNRKKYFKINFTSIIIYFNLILFF